MKFMKPFILFKELQEMKTSKRGRFLGLNIVNDKHVDLAMSDPSNKNAVPLSAINMEECNMDLMAEKFQTLNSKHNFTGFVVGFPYVKCYHVNQGSEMTAMRQIVAPVKNFINDLSKTGKLQGLKYTYWDDILALESMDFVVKHNVAFILATLNEFNLDTEQSSSSYKKNLEQIVEKFVAARMLQGYLDSANAAEEFDNFHK